MGRYYSGDIEGKFWFAVQSSNDADFFGVEGTPPNQLDYYFSDTDLPAVEQALQKCKDALGEWRAKLDSFFGEGGPGYNGYNDKMLVDYGIAAGEIVRLLEWYARLELGEKIRKCISEHGSCSFEAEC